MAAKIQEPVCWRAANPCPQSLTSSSLQLSCQAWFRCEKARDYVIRWKCQPLNEEGINLTGSALSLCSNQSDSWQLTECPAPVVCADDQIKVNTRVKNTSTSTEIAVVVALAVFALLAVLLIIVSSYKYWAMRRRYRTQKRLPARHESRHYLFRDFQSPAPYDHVWGSSFQQYRYQSNNNWQLTKPHGSSYPDVYFSRPQESWRYFEHLLTSSDDSMGNNIGKHDKRGQVYSKGGRLKVDPSVATESFVYHQPGRADDLLEISEGSEGWQYQDKQVNEDHQKNMECYHIYKGNLSRYRTHEQQYACRNYTHSRNEYHRFIKSSTDFAHAPQVSSIPIPSLNMRSLQEPDSHCQHLDSDTQLREKTRDALLTQRQFDSDSSNESMSLYARGNVTKIRSTLHNNISSNSGNHWGKRHHQSTVLNEVKVQAASTTPTHRTSPDVINSHNFTNRFVRVGHNIYKPVLTKSPSDSSITLSSTNSNYIDLCYDSFLNQHLHELTKRGVASSSTLEASHRQKEEDSSQETNNRF